MNCPFSDILGTEPDIVNKDIEAETEKELLRGALSKLSAQEREIMQLRFWAGGKCGTDAKGSCRQAGYFSIIYFPLREKDN